jgi:hypothetical protein
MVRGDASVTAGDDDVVWRDVRLALPLIGAASITEMMAITTITAEE